MRSALCRRGWLGGARRFGAHRGRGAGHIVAAARLQLVKFISVTFDIAMNRKIATQNIRTAVSCMEHSAE